MQANSTDQLELDKDRQLERTWVGDDHSPLAQLSVERFLRIWAQVGRAILYRRQNDGQDGR